MTDYLTAFLGFFFSDESQLILMFFSAFLSSTVLPGNSEIVFSTLIAQNSLNSGSNVPLVLFILATAGNALGSFTTYLMALLLPKVNLDTQKKAVKWAITYSRKYGAWILLLSWLPVIGDLLCGIAGWLRLNVWQSLLFITLGKAIRYAVLWWSVATFFS